MAHHTPTHLVQMTHPDEGRRAALVHGNELHLLATYRSVYHFAAVAIETGWKLRDLLSTDLSGIVLDYDQVYALETQWRFLPAFDHASEAGRCLVTGWSGDPPVWRYQGSGDCLCGHGQPLTVAGLPSAIHLPEVAAAYVIGEGGISRRVGVAAGIRGPSRCALGPELILEADFPYLAGVARLIRAGCQTWSREVSAKDSPLTIALASAEADHFKSADHRRVGDAHVHFFGAKLFRQSDDPLAGDGDETDIEWTGFGRKLRNRILAEQPAPLAVAALPL